MKKSIIALGAFLSFSCATASTPVIPDWTMGFNFKNYINQDVKISIVDDSGYPQAALSCQSVTIATGGTVNCHNQTIKYPMLPMGRIALVTRDNQHRCDYSYLVTFDEMTFLYTTTLKLDGSANMSCVQDYSQNWTFVLRD